jgi:ABC-type dipeptide/oligopeptide/nickel transport system ATPase subunit
MNVRLSCLLCGAYCQSQLYSSKESFLPITYTFTGGSTYGLISEFGCGGWALATCLGGRCDELLEGEIYLNDEQINCVDLQRYSCFVGENSFYDATSVVETLTVRECIDNAIKISGIPYSSQEIKDMFSLSDERFERDLNHVSGEIRRISVAIGFALNREIFCYPWLNSREISSYVDIKLVNTLKKHNKIIVIPTGRASIRTPLRKVFDSIIDFHDFTGKYFCIHPEERKKLKKYKGW